MAQEYYSNAIKFVSMKNLKPIDLKSCNISMQQLLLVSIHDIYAKKKKNTHHNKTMLLIQCYM